MDGRTTTMVARITNMNGTYNYTANCTICLMENWIKIVDCASHDVLDALFDRYHRGQYNSLLLNPVTRLSYDEMKSTLVEYMLYFTGPQASTDDGRKESLTTTMAKGDLKELVNLLKCDQYMEEPLFRIANKMI